MLNVSVHAASTAASTTGRYSGLQPASTALIATFSTVHSTRSGGTTATMSSGARSVPSSMRSTRASVGGTTGSPSLQPRSNIASASSSRSASCTRRAWSFAPSNRTRSPSAIGGIDRQRAAPRSHVDQVGTEPVAPVSASHWSRLQPDGSLAFDAVLDAQHGRHRFDRVVVRHREVVVVHDLADAGGERRVVLREHGERDVGRNVELREHGLDHPARRDSRASRRPRHRPAAPVHPPHLPFWRQPRADMRRR